jgi:hypothetical protein
MAVSRINEAGLNVNQYGNRNIIINGGMDVCQRSTSVTGLGTAETYFVQDRYKLSLGDASAGRLTATKETTDVPDGFGSAMKLACTTADTSIAAGEFLGINQHIEADACVRTQTGTSSAKQITLSFYAKADSTKTYVVQVLNNKHSGYIHNNRTFTVTSSWQRFTMTFQADTTADSKFDGDLTTAGFSVTWTLHAGSNYTSATLASDWATGVTNRAAGADSFFSATSNTFLLTGVQLEVGDTATDFEHRTFADELRRCQRYLSILLRDDENDDQNIGSVYQATRCFIKVFHKVTMRAVPTVSLVGAIDANLYHNGSAVAASGINASYPKKDSTGLDFTPSSSLTAGNAFHLDWATSDTQRYVKAEAEL